jgi:alpha-mannosidase
VTRGLIAEGRPDELGLATYPASRYVQAGQLSVAFSGVREYELVAIRDGQANELAITLLRSTGMLSRLGMVNRPFPAGPLTPAPALQMLGETISFSCRIGVGIDAIALAERHDLPLEAVSSLGGGDLDRHGRLLDIRGAVVSSLRRHHGGLLLRLYNPRDEGVDVSLGDHQVDRVTLAGQVTGAVTGSFFLEAHEIATLLVRES